MPKLDSQTFTTAGTEFNFGGTPPGKLGADSYSLVHISLDVSPSVSPFSDLLISSTKEIVRSCIKSPRRDNLMLRLETFSDTCKEIHGFKPFTAIDLDTNDPKRPDEYSTSLITGGGTDLYHAVTNAYLAMKGYAKELRDKRFDVNGSMFVITDGEDNMASYSSSSLDTILQAREDMIGDEALESLNAILVGVNVKSSRYKKYLDDFCKDAKFTDFIAIEDASAKAFAKLVKYVSSNVSAQSQQVATGQPSQLLTF
jgi:uncharacterized protein YegL